MNLNITTEECSWAKFELKVLNRTTRGLRAFSVKKTKDQEHLHASGDEPIDILSGNKKYEGKIKILGFELDAMNKAANDAGYDDITEVPHEVIVITIAFKKRATDPIKTYVASGVSFGECGTDMEQGAKFREIELPYLCMGLKFPT